MRTQNQLAMSLRERLRVETREQHEALEAQLDLMRLDFSREDLVRVLERFYGYYLPCETQLESLQRKESQIDSAVREMLLARKKVPLLECDLLYFGHTAASIAKLPHCEVAHADNTAKVLGRWYVLEGSTLGGQYLIARFIKKLELPDNPTEGGCAFFASYGDRVGEMWKTYCSMINTWSAAASPDDDAEAIASAGTTFEELSRWMAGC